MTLPVLLGAALAVTGCATTGQAWVQQPENALSMTASPELEPRVTAEPVGAIEPSPLSGEAPRRRLDHVVSLGEGAASAAPPSSAVGGPSSATTPVVVNIVSYAAPSYGYAPGYAPAYSSVGYRPTSAGVSRVAPVNIAPGGTPPLGHDWQAPRSYGPNFPYHTGPASPWERPR
jgi:hypothetical protein